MTETRQAADLWVDTTRPGVVGHTTRTVHGVTLVLAVIVDADEDPEPHLCLLLAGYEAGWALAVRELADPAPGRRANSVVAPAGLSAVNGKTYVDAFHTGYEDRRRIAEARGSDDEQAQTQWEDPSIVR
jgi:hypothetical protein